MVGRLSTHEWRMEAYTIARIAVRQARYTMLHSKIGPRRMTTAKTLDHDDERQREPRR
jgi:hypothetical protein